MAFRLELKLEDMKRIIGWDEHNFYDAPPSRYAGPDPKYPLPFRTTNAVRLTSIEDVRSTASRLGRSYQWFLQRHFGLQVPNYTHHFSEPLQNVFAHGGEEARQADTLIESYFTDRKPEMPLEFIVRITNPNAQEWDFERVIAEALKVDPKKVNPQDVHWLTSVNWHEYPWVSYDNKGKDYLALFRVEPTKPR
ncbi:MAG: hypothetical protein AABX34_04825 [Nanoarchaeota archaeon]